MALSLPAPITPSRFTRRVAEVFADLKKFRTDRVGIFTDSRGNIWLGTDCGLPASENSCLLQSDHLARIAEIIHMIEVDTGYHRAISIENIDCVQSSAQPHFQDRNLYL